MTEPTKKNGRAPLIAIGISVGIATLVFTVIGTQIASIKDQLTTHESLQHHAAMGEQMAAVRQRLVEQDLKTSDRFTAKDWMAAKELILALFDHVNARLKIIEERHIRDTEAQRKEPTK